MRSFLWLFFLPWVCDSFTQQRISSYPYISGDTFRAFADHIIDETGVPFLVENVKKGDIIFLKTDYLAFFFTQIHQRIQDQYILITHNSDFGVPGNLFESFLNDPKLYAWYGQNIDRSHPKLHAIPIGLANRYWPHGNIEVVQELQARRNSFEKNIFLYINYSAQTSSERANAALEQLTRLPCAYVPARKPFADYAHDLAHATFVVSPPGNGQDCHRTWEALYLGAIPIVKSSPLNPLFVDLPVLVVQEWAEITEQKLNEVLHEYQNKRFCHQKIYAEYWYLVLKNKQDECRK